MRRFFVSAAFLLLWMSSSFAQLAPMRLFPDSPWDYVEKNTWRLDFSGFERPETIIAVEFENVFYFTSYAECGDGQLQVFSWVDGEKKAKGITCDGKTIRISTKVWEGRVSPRPPIIAKQ